jgi:hypothetical protein
VVQDFGRWIFPFPLNSCREQMEMGKWLIWRKETNDNGKLKGNCPNWIS